MRKWKCTVCDYIHEGDNPPDECPLCGVGPELFVEIIDTVQSLCPESVRSCNVGTIRSSLEKISYGLYVLTSRDKAGKINGQCVNTVFQLTDIPQQIAVSVSNETLTCEYIKESGVMAISFLRADDIANVRHFGLQTGRKIDKFQGIDYILGNLGCPILSNCLSYLEGKVLWDKTSNVGTHTLFVVEVTGGLVANTGAALTYEKYRESKNK